MVVLSWLASYVSHWCWLVFDARILSYIQGSQSNPLIVEILRQFHFIRLFLFHFFSFNNFFFYFELTSAARKSRYGGLRAPGLSNLCFLRQSIHAERPGAALFTYFDQVLMTRRTLYSLSRYHTLNLCTFVASDQKRTRRTEPNTKISIFFFPLLLLQHGAVFLALRCNFFLLRLE